MALEQPKKLLIIQDISCIGRCSMTVALPVLSCLGIQTVPLPTVLLSAHTAFPQVYRRGLTEEMQGILSAWESLPLAFDGIYIGYLGDAQLLPLVADILARYKGPDTRLYIDPVMGDHGKRYAFCTEELTAGYRALCAQADVIFPNRTEAGLLLQTPWAEEKTAEETLAQLCALGAKTAVLTGVERGGVVGVMAQSGQQCHQCLLSKLPGAYPGTGDLLAAAMIGALMRGQPLPRALEAALHFVHGSIQDAAHNKDPRYGVPFEHRLPLLIKDVLSNHLAS